MRAMKRCTQKLGHDILRYVSKFRDFKRNNEFFLAKNHRKNILKRTVAKHKPSLQLNVIQNCAM